MSDVRDPQTDQDLPQVNDRPFVQDMVIADVEARKELGIRKYGTALQPGNGRNMLLDAYEEALDLVIYLRGALEEQETGRPAPAAQAEGTRAELEHFKPQPMSQRCRDGEHAADRDDNDPCYGCRCLCHNLEPRLQRQDDLVAEFRRQLVGLDRANDRLKTANTEARQAEQERLVMLATDALKRRGGQTGQAVLHAVAEGKCSRAGCDKPPADGYVTCNWHSSYQGSQR